LTLPFSPAIATNRLLFTAASAKGEVMGDRDHKVVHAGGGKAFGVRDLAERELHGLLEDPDELLWRNLHRPVKLGYGSLMVEAELTLVGGPAHVIYKRYGPRGWWKSFCSIFRQSRARRAWHLARALLARQVDTARPLAVCEPHRPWFARASYLASEWIADAENLHIYGWRLADRPIRKRLRRAARCAESLGHLIGHMHASQIAHRDLKGANLLVADRGDRVAAYLIDVDGARICRHLSPARRAANLARLAAGIEAHPWVTRTMYCRFLRAYVRQFPPGQIAWKLLWRDVSARSRRMVIRKRRRGEQVL